jgi:hypothetical protein
MSDDSDWAGRGFTRPGPDPRLEQLPPVPAGAWSGDCPLCMWDGPGHSAPFAGHVPDHERDREAG